MFKRDALTPQVPNINRVLGLVGDLLDADTCWLLDGAYHFVLAPARSISVRPESASRFRICSCVGGRPVATVFAFDGDDARLRRVIEDMVQDAAVAA